MLRRSLGMPELADKIDRAIDQVLDEGQRTADLGGKVIDRTDGRLRMSSARAPVVETPRTAAAAPDAASR